ncbi:MAG: MauE/DoxX family redox-associated membrane protein, partial [Prevotella sp.]
MAVFVNVCRLLVALTFVFSGYVKAVDPLGTQYKMQDYLSVFGVAANSYNHAILVFAIILGALEFCLGIYLFFAIYRRQVSRLLLVFISLMTLLSLWLMIYDPITDCGCFGDALLLSNTQTFIKNIILLLLTWVVVYRPESMLRFVSHNNQWIVANYTVVFILFTS